MAGTRCWLVRVFMVSQGGKEVTGQEQEMTCTAASDVKGGSGAVQVGMDTGLLQVLVMSVVSLQP